MSDRKDELRRRYAWYEGAAYDARAYDWNGKRIPHSNTQAIAGITGTITPLEAMSPVGPDGKRIATPPPPISDRQPMVRSRLNLAVVTRFTDFLFSEFAVPTVRHKASDSVTDVIQQGLNDMGFWPHMTDVRNFGGATGSAVSAFAIDDGDVVLTAVDPRYATPVFRPGRDCSIRALVIEYLTEGEKQRFKREIDGKSDTVYQLADKAEPRWLVDTTESIEHGLEGVPVVWTHNIRRPGHVDGWADVRGPEAEMAVDYLVSQATRGSIASCDPTIVVSDDEGPEEVVTGSGVSLTLSTQGRATLLELQGSGPMTALAVADKVQRQLERESQVVLDGPIVGDRATAEEVQAGWTGMQARVSALKEQYGYRHARTLIVKVMRAAARVHGTPLIGADGQQVVDVLTGKPVVRVVNFLVDVGARVIERLRELSVRDVEVTWNRFDVPNMDDISKAVTAAAHARNNGLISTPMAVRFLAPYLGILDANKMSQEATAELKNRIVLEGTSAGSIQQSADAPQAEAQMKAAEKAAKPTPAPVVTAPGAVPDAGAVNKGGEPPPDETGDDPPGEEKK